MPRVRIEVAGHVVEVESDDDSLAKVARKARRLHEATKDPRLSRGYPAGFASTERAPEG